MAYRQITNLIFEPRGKHDSTAAYNIKDTVMSADGTKVYFALQDVPAGIELTNEDYWMLQIDLSGTNAAMQNAIDSANNAIANFGNYAREIGLRVKGETAQASGNPVTFLPDAGSLLQPKTVFEPKQDGSGDPSPENIRPIGGFDALELTAEGKNLFDSAFVVDRTQGGLTTQRQADGTIRLTGTAESASRAIQPTNSYLLTLKPGTYTLKPDNFALRYLVDDVPNYYSKTFTVENETEIVQAAFNVVAGQVYDEIVSIQLEASPTATEYEQYQQTDLHTVQIGQTIYGGRMDWITGKLTAEWVMVTLDGTEAFQSISDIYNGTGRTFLPITQPSTIVPSNMMGDVVCSHYPTVIYNNINSTNGIIGASTYSSGIHLAIRMQFTTMNEWTAYLAAQNAAGTPVQIVYKLASPIEIQLTPQIIPAAEPEQVNTLYGDGSIEVTYVKPLHISIEERVSAAVQAALATNATE